jgi:hypothetical protein
MTKQLRNLSALLRMRQIPDERVTRVEITRERAFVALEFLTEQDAAAFGQSTLADGSAVQKVEDEVVTFYSSELSFRGCIYRFILFVPKVDIQTLAQPRVN